VKNKGTKQRSKIIIGLRIREKLKLKSQCYILKVLRAV
jgi:hypothetical protein